MTWRVRLARFILRSDPDWMVCLTSDYCAFIRLLVEEDKVRSIIAQHAQLGPVLDLLPRKPETRH